MYRSCLKFLGFFLISSCLSWGAAIAPMIATQPVSHSVIAGQTARFAVVARGTAPMAYQWLKNGSPVGGATSASYTTPATVASDSGSAFMVKVANAAGTTQSAAATLTVNLPPAITTEPATQAVVLGSSATFSVLASGTGTLAYQWYKGGTVLAGATSASFTTPATTSADNGARFTVKVSNAYGRVTSTAATLTVNRPAAITTQPADKAVTLGATATFRVVASGTGSLSYQWFKNGTAVPGATAASYTTPATAAPDSGASFTVQVSNAYGSVASAAATLTVNLPPAITTGPANQTVLLGSSATFSVLASGTGALVYQWYQGGTVINGATSASFTTPATTPADNGARYTVKVSNAYGRATSAAATLVVDQPVVITTQPADRAVTLGATATFRVVASGTGTLSYQWSRNGTAIPGATAASYTTSATVAPDSGASFTVQVSNAYGSVASAAATLTVNLPPVITTEPVNQTVILGSSATFSVLASGTGTLAYQWYQGGTAIEGATSASYTTPATTRADNGARFTVKVSNGYGHATSPAATLALDQPAVITIQPADRAVPLGATAKFRVVASGMGTLSYQWSKNGTVILDATAASYTTPAAAAVDSGTSFTVQVNNAYGSVTSAVATLTVYLPALITSQPASQTVTLGSPATFAVAASGTGPLSYQWTRNGTFIPGATSASYTTPATSAADNGASFTVQVSNPYGSVTSGTATLNVNVVAPVISSFTASPNPAQAGQTVTFSWNASNVTGLSLGTDCLECGRTDLTGQSSYSVTLGAYQGSYSTNYILYGDSAAGETSSRLTLQVTGPQIASFTSSSAAPAAGAPIQLTALFSGGEGVVQPGSLDITSGMPMTVTPGSRTEYTLTVSNAFGATDTLTIEVAPLAPAGMFSPGPAMHAIHETEYGTSAVTPLADGGLMVVGGTTLETCDPNATAFSSIPGTFSCNSSYGMSTTLMPSGDVAILNGWNGTDAVFASFGSWWMGLFNQAGRVITQQTVPLSNSQPNTIYQGATLLLNGQLLTTGGATEVLRCGSYGTTVNAAVLDPYVAVPDDPYVLSPGPYSNYSLNPLFLNHASGMDRDILLPSGKVLIIPGYGSDVYQLYNPATGTVSDLPLSFSWTPILLLHSGQVLIAGQVDDVFQFASWDPEQGTLSKGAAVPADLDDFRLDQARLLPDGKVFLPSSSSSISGNSFLLDPVAQTILNLGPMSTDEFYRFSHTASLSSTGKVLILGGTGSAGYLTSTVLFDPQLPFTLSPAFRMVKTGDYLVFTAKDSAGANVPVTWSSTAGVITPQGIWTAPATPGIYVVNALDASGHNLMAQITVVNPHTGFPDQNLEVSISPTIVQLAPGATQVFTTNGVPTGAPNLHWTTSGGTVGAGGTYTAPLAVGSYTVTATRPDDATLSASATVVVSSAGSGPIPPPMIHAFSASAPVAVVGQSVTLVWNALGADQLTLYANGLAQNVTGRSGIAVYPSTTTTYYLMASNPSGTVESSSITIGTVPYPISIRINPEVLTLYAGQTEQFGYNLTAPTDRMVWSTSSGTITQTGLFVAPAAPGTVTVTVTSVDDPSKSDTATVTVQDILLTLTPQTASLSPGQFLRFGYSCTGSTGAMLVWSCTGGTITQEGLYTAPATYGTYIVSVYSSADPALIQSATVTVAAPVQIIPGVAILSPGGTQVFRAFGNPGTVSWSVVQNGGGTITPGGLYTAPLAPGNYTVQGLSNTYAATATVVVTQSGSNGSGGSNTAVGASGVSITLSPTVVATTAGVGFPFLASVSGTSNASVSWSVVSNPPTSNAQINAQGVFTADREGLYQIQVQSVADPTAVLTAQVNVASSVSLTQPPMGSNLFSGYTVTALQDGRVLIAGGLQLPQPNAPQGNDGSFNYVSSGLAWIFDPATGNYQATGSMITPRNCHQAVLLNDGRVLMMGGYAQWYNSWSQYVTAPPIQGQPYTTWDEEYPAAEVYDPVSGTFHALPTGSLPQLVGAEGQAIFNNPPPSQPGQMFSTHPNGTAITMSNGQVLAVGGDGRGYWGAGIDISLYGTYGTDPLDLFTPGPDTFDLNGSAPWRSDLGFSATYAGSSYYVGFGQAPCSVLLPNGKVLLTCGAGNDMGWGYPLAAYGGLDRPNTTYPAVSSTTAEILDPETLGVSNTGSMQVPRFAHTMTVLPDGRVLAVGGKDLRTCQTTARSRGAAWNWASTATAEIYDPNTNTWTPTVNLATHEQTYLNFDRAYHAAILLPTGQVLIVGGYHSDLNGNLTWPSTTELFDPSTGVFSVMDTLDYGISSPQLAMMNNGQVFVAGQYEPPMTPPIQAQNQPESEPESKIRAMDAGIPTTITAGSDLMGEINPHQVTWVWWMSRDLNMTGKQIVLNDLQHSVLVIRTGPNFSTTIQVQAGPSGPNGTGLDFATQIPGYPSPPCSTTVGVAILKGNLTANYIQNLVNQWNIQNQSYDPLTCNCNTFALWLWNQLGCGPVSLNWQYPN